ncbi:heavy metal efflux protein, putative [Parvularcula bermudensis HTCC2503]|uniref:Heavy metal efflux protein, putative n=1 Tax=Parvularcula bermudensis (strain ATCC BAA-594 / HTCC2503 / KCTC 12087) TaxID=314260 RepID=E0THY9_PARBH|nr:efflux RND transporter periplasmic adaptor subunit [Parvularcula bermudensis]ADM10800.1 heavy metal efflux protein, putative [Parvularcula bermudensis HTCC2503]
MKHLILILIVLFAGAAHAQETETYTCPMHPHYISMDADGVCPICGMDLVPVSEAPLVDGGDQAGIAVSPAMIQTMGVRTAPAEVVSFARQVRAFGRVEPSTRAETVAASRVEGWIEDLAVTAEGDRVEAGDLLYRVYSPDLIGAQQDYLAALRSGAGGRIEAAAQRLRSLGMQDGVIATLREGRAVIERMPVTAEEDGVVSALSVREGTYVTPGDVILRLQRYDEVWIIASVAEQDLPLIAEGTPATVTVSAAAVPEREATVDYVYPTIDPETRTGRVRIVLSNDDQALRTGAYADVTFAVDDRPRLSVPSEAILRDSRGAHVVMALGGGRFAPRPVQTGLSALGQTEIVAGLEPGEEIVTSGQFLLDSEASLREGFSKMGGGLGPEVPLSDLPMTDETLAMVDHFVDAALYFHEALVDGYAVQPSFLDPTLGVGETLRARYANTRLSPIILHAEGAVRAAQEAGGPAELADALSDLMEGLRPWLLEGAPQHYADEGLTLFRAGEDRLWVQEGSQPANPYGDGDAERIVWPDVMAMDDASDRPAMAGHNH